MNVVRLEKSTLVGGRGRGRGRGRRAEIIVPNNTIPQALPKYEFRTERWPLVNFDPSTSTTTAKTPRKTRRDNTTSSSSVRNSAFRGRGRNIGASAQLSTTSAITEPDSCNIIAITSGRGDARGEVGMAVIDIRQPHLILCQISDCHTYANTLSKIHAMQPIEIIMPDTMCDRNNYPSGLYRAIKEKFETITITRVARMHFHDSAGLERIRTHCAEEFSSVELYVNQKYYALAAAAALLKYVEFIQHIVYAPKSMRIDFQGSQNGTMIDIESAQSLELVTSQGGPLGYSLLGTLDRCSTPMGRRLLRVLILQPPCNVEFIRTRQACVAEFVSNRSLHSIVQPVVKRLSGASRLLSLGMMTSQTDTVLAAERNLNYILLLKNLIDVVPELCSVLTTAQAPFFRKVSENLKDPRYRLIKDEILGIVHAEARAVNGFTSSNMQRCFAIRSGISDMLDIARQAYCELIDDMQNFVEKLANKYNMSLSLGCNSKLGYHIQMDVPRRYDSSKIDFPNEFIEVHQQKNTIFMTTEYLRVLSQHCKDACQELHLMSNVLLNKTLTAIREQIGCLLKLSDDVAELDIVSSLAQVSAIPDFVRPTFGSKLELRNSRHPVMDICGVDGNRIPVANDVVASYFRNFNNITGPNMSGKSVYLKQIVLLQIMAQIGCYVPASSAKFRITDRIFCRMCVRGDIDCDASTFVLEIKEIHYILQSITPTSLVILDELCRSTAVEEGTSIAWAVAEELALNSRAFVFNATHFLYLTKLAELYQNVTNYHFETESNVSSSASMNGEARLIYTHRLKTGVSNVWNYGIALARSTGLPPKIVHRAQQLANEIAATVIPTETVQSRENRISNKLYYNFFAELVEIFEENEFTIESVNRIVREMNIPNFTVVSAENVTSDAQETSSSDFSHKFQKPLNRDKPLHPKKQTNVASLSLNDELKKLWRLENSQNIVPLSSGTREINFVEKYPSSKNSVASSNALSVRNISSPNSFTSTGDRPSRPSSLDRKRRKFTSPKSTTTNENDFKSAAEDSTDPSSQQSCPGGVSSPEKFNSANSIATPIARILAREKEADIFRIIEGNNFDETSFYHSFMNPVVTIDSSDEDKP